MRGADLSGFGVFNQNDSTAIPPNSQVGGQTWAGRVVNEQRALQMTTLWSCVSLISDTVSQLPVTLNRGQGPTRQRMADPKLLTNPYGDTTWPEWIGMEMASCLLRGNAYGVVVERDAKMVPTQIMPLHPDEIWLKDEGWGGWGNVPLSTLAPIWLVRGQEVPRTDIFHVPGFKLPGSRSIEGLSPIGYARQTIGLALGAEEFAARFFGDGASPSGILTTDAVLDGDYAEKIQQKWLENHGQRQRKPAVLGAGLKWQAISITPEESQFLATIGAKNEEIAGFYRCPPHMVGLANKTSNWGTGVEENMLQFAQFTLGIWLVRFEAALSALYPKPQYVKFNLNALLRAKTLERFQAYTLARQGGWENIDDVRAHEDEPPLPEGKGQDYLQPLNFAPIPPGGMPAGAVPGVHETAPADVTPA
jgi:HK97 family phage portal protein